MEIKVS
jgi:transcription elongation factor S-II